MKKIYFILIVIIVLIVLVNTKEEVIVVNSIINNDEMVEAVIMVPNLNTNNFMNYFSDDIEIVGIYPKINLLYKDKISSTFYRFSKTSIRDNINAFTRYYKSILKKNNFTGDLVLTDYNGINIDKVKIYASVNYIRNFVKKCSDCSYNI